MFIYINSVSNEISMNIFYLHPDPQKCAEMHLDKHCVKMILEYSQLLSTAHRVLDGKDNILPDNREQFLYRATHVNHPSARWARMCYENYDWLVRLLECLHAEYTHRYGKVHKSESMLDFITAPPDNIPFNESFTEPIPAMPDDCKIDDNSIASYRKYYQLYKSHIARWTSRPIPHWYHILLLENKCLN